VTLDRTDRRLWIAAVVLAVIGLGVAAYLTYIHYEGIKPVCGLGGNCEKVQTSDWSKLAGVPVALLGLIGYVGILISLFLPGDLGRASAFFLALVGFLFSGYLTYRELFSIHAICPWCVSSAVIMTLLTIVTGARLVRGAAPVGRSLEARSEPGL